jgi:phage/plasmid-like protein (TIGR03299 family)
MSRETLTDLNTNTLIGYTDKRGKAWHYRADEQGGESNHYPGAIPAADVRRRLFNWEAVEGEITANALTPDGVLSTTDPDRKAIMRSDTGAILGIFKRGYVAHQFDPWLIQNVENILDADLAIGSAGLLSGGAKAWVQVEMVDTITTPSGVAFRPFLTAATSMDGSLASTYLVGAQVVVCDNTLSAALGEKVARVKVKHSARSLSKINDVRDALGIVHAVADDFSAQVAALTAQVVTDQQWKDFVKAYTAGTSDSKHSLTIAERKTGELFQLWNFDERVAPWKGSAYGVLAAANTHTHHLGTVRGSSRADRNMERAITSGVDKMDRDILALLATVSV